MSKAGKFIQEHTKALKESNGKEYFMWISPDQARKAVEIAREEILLEVAEWIKDTFIFSENAKKDFSQTFNIKLL